MGAQQARLAGKHLDGSGGEVNFDHFHVLRVIGKGSFGKVCIVQKRDTGKMYAMKYMNKTQCLEKEAMKNVVREMNLLRQLEHPFLVNLWFSFQDVEDLFMVVDLLLGGDLRYHLQQNVTFGEDSIRLYLCEIASALDYLKANRIIHRDVKPENVILDEEGHAHLTDFNIATVLEEGEMAVSISGTKPYMAPEVYRCAVDCEACYSYPVDWWSLGVCLFELVTGYRPFDIHSVTSAEECLRCFDVDPVLPNHVSRPLREAIGRLLQVNVKRRVASLAEVRTFDLLRSVNWDAVLAKQIKPSFTPPKGHLNCDPSLELEEMIMESKPLHKKKKRLMKQLSSSELQSNKNANTTALVTGLMGPVIQPIVSPYLEGFVSFNREFWLAEQERISKEEEWERELLAAMAASGVSPPQVIVNQVQKAHEESMRTAEASVSSPFRAPDGRLVRSLSLRQHGDRDCRKKTFRRGSVVRDSALRISPWLCVSPSAGRHRQPAVKGEYV